MSPESAHLMEVGFINFQIWLQRLLGDSVKIPVKMLSWMQGKIANEFFFFILRIRILLFFPFYDTLIDIFFLKTYNGIK
jgi:hypothetical protein